MELIKSVKGCTGKYPAAEFARPDAMNVGFGVIVCWRYVFNAFGSTQKWI
ncbi:hypothetical protein N9383_04430 [Granulosicoccus sp.]|nr:hypothetical protein [Granulosicoccus sp.]